MKKWLLLVGFLLLQFSCNAFKLKRNTGPESVNNSIQSSQMVLAANNDYVQSSLLMPTNENFGNYFFSSQDWLFVLLPYLQTIANQGLTCWIDNLTSSESNGEALYDYEVDALINSVTQTVIGGRQDEFKSSVFKSVTGNEINPKRFLKNQSSWTANSSAISSKGGGWDSISLGNTQDLQTVQTVLQSGFANSIAQYSAALIENFAGRIAVATSFFQSSASGNSLVTQKNSGFLGYTNATQQLQTLPYSLPGYNASNASSVYNEQAIVSNCMSLAQTVFQRARYARLMYQFPKGLQKSLASYTKNGGLKSLGQPASLFVVPTDLVALDTLVNQSNSNVTMAPDYTITVEEQSLQSQPLGPVYTFAGVIVIDDLSTNIAQEVAGNSAGSLYHLPPTISLPPLSPGGVSSYANVYFLPAANASVSVNPNQPLPYKSYAPVDQQANVSGTSAIQRKVTFNTSSGITINGAYQNGSLITIMVTDLPVYEGYPNTVSNIYQNNEFGVYGQDPLGIVFQYGSSGSMTSVPLNFSDTVAHANDFQNFFAYPTQWALVLKLTMVQNGSTSSPSPSVLGLVKLNPYDFPLNFTTSAMQTVLGVPATQSVGGSATVNAGGMQSLLTAPATNPSFSQKDVWDGIADLYSTVFPAGYNTSASVINSICAGIIQYPFSYLLLQGLMNGYLMSNTYNVMFNMTNWPNLNQGNVNSEYDTYYGKNGYYSSAGAATNSWGIDINYIASSAIIMDQVFPTPLSSDWLSSNSPLDWLYLRGFMAMRLVLQSIYCPYDALILPLQNLNNAGDIGVFSEGNFSNLSPCQGMTSLLEYMFAYPDQTLLLQISNAANTFTAYRAIYGQKYTSGSTNQNATSYQWILPYLGVL